MDIKASQAKWKMSLINIIQIFRNYSSILSVSHYLSNPCYSCLKSTICGVDLKIHDYVFMTMYFQSNYLVYPFRGGTQNKTATNLSHGHMNLHSYSCIVVCTLPPISPIGRVCHNRSLSTQLHSCIFLMLGHILHHFYTCSHIDSLFHIFPAYTADHI